MKLFKRFVLTAMTAVLSAALLTACGGGGGGTSGGGTAIAPVEFKSTKTYKLVLTQEPQKKSMYMEYWDGSTDSTGAWVENKEYLTKSGTLDGKNYSDRYMNGVFWMTILNDGQNIYEILSAQSPQYSNIVKSAELGGAKIPEGKTVYFDEDRVSREIIGEGVKGVNFDMSQLKESDVIVSNGTYNGYYAEIFTWKTDPQKSVTIAYDENDEIKAAVYVYHNKTYASFYNKFEFDSPQFNAARLELSYYNAMDITDAYIAALKQAMSGGVTN